MRRKMDPMLIRLQRFVLRWLRRMVLLSVFVVLPAVLIFLAQVGLPNALCDRLEEELARLGVPAEVQRLTIHLTRGVVAENVKVFDARESGKVLAQVNSVSVIPRLAGLLRGRFEINALELRGAQMYVPVGGEDQPPVTVDGLNARILMEPGQLRVSEAEGEIEGLSVRTSGVILHPEQWKPSEKKETPNTAQLVETVRGKLREFKFEGVAPEISWEFSVDLSDPQSLVIYPLRIAFDVVHHDDVELLRNFLLEAEFANQRLTIHRLEWSEEGGNGRFLASGFYDIKDRRAEAEVFSGIDPAPLLIEAGVDSKLWKDVTWGAAPSLTLRASADFNQKPPVYRVTGSLYASDITYREVHVESVAADFIFANNKWYARDIRVTMGGGEVVADVMSMPGDFRGRVRSEIMPSSILPLLNDNDRMVVGQFHFEKPPVIQLKIQGLSPDPATWVCEGDVSIGPASMRGVGIDSGYSKLEIVDRAVTYRDFSLKKGHASAQGVITYDIGRQEVRFQNIRSTINPVDVFTWIDPNIAETLKPYRFRGQPVYRADGVTGLRDDTRNRVDVSISAPDGLVYELFGKDLVFGSTEGRVEVRGRKMAIHIDRAALYGGNVNLKADVSLDPKAPLFDAILKLSEVDFATLTKLYFDYSESQGRLSADYAFSLRLDDERSMKGSGRGEVRDGNVFAIPLFGPLSDVLNAIIPGAGYETARLGKASFTVENGRINTKDMEVEGRGFSMYGEGDIWYLDDRMKFFVRINAQGVPGILLFPVSKVFEYVSDGKATSPVWRPKLIPKGFPALFGGGRASNHGP